MEFKYLEQNIKLIFGKKRIFLFVLLSIGFRLLLPENISFLGDEAKLLTIALEGFYSGEFAEMGLLGTRGFHYGPVGPNFYLFIMFLTRNIFHIATIKTIIVSCLNLIGLALIFKRFKSIKRILWFFVFLSPYFWFYSRTLWDNTLLIGLTSLGVGLYFEFHFTRKFGFLFLSAMMFSLSVLTHLMVAPLCLAIFFHLLIFHYQYIKKNWKLFIFLLFSVLVLICPYLLDAFRTREKVDFVSGFSIESLIFPFTGIKLFSFLDVEYFFGSKWEWLLSFNKATFELLRSVKILWYSIYLIGALGLYEFIKRAISFKQYKNDEMTHAGILVLLTLSCHLVVCLISNLSKHPHYFNGVWVMHFFILAMGINKLLKLSEKFKLYQFIFLFSMFGFLLWTFRMINYHGGTRSQRHGTILGQKVKIATELNRHPGLRKIKYDQIDFRYETVSIEVLQALFPAKATEAKKHNYNSAHIKYAMDRDSNVKNGHARVKLQIK